MNNNEESDRCLCGCGKRRKRKLDGTMGKTTGSRSCAGRLAKAHLLETLKMYPHIDHKIRTDNTFPYPNYPH